MKGLSPTKMNESNSTAPFFTILMLGGIQRKVKNYARKGKKIIDDFGGLKVREKIVSIPQKGKFWT